MDPDKRVNLGDKLKECEVQFLSTEQILKDAKEIIGKYESDYKKLAK